MGKHTPGLLQTEPDTFNGCHDLFAMPDLDSNFFIGEITHKDDAARIVACWNALEGHEPAALADVVEALKNCIANISYVHGEGWTVLNDARAALAAFNAPAEPVPDIEQTCASIARTAADMGGGDD